MHKNCWLRLTNLQTETNIPPQSHCAGSSCAWKGRRSINNDRHRGGKMTKSRGRIHAQTKSRRRRAAQRLSYQSVIWFAERPMRLILTHCQYCRSAWLGGVVWWWGDQQNGNTQQHPPTRAARNLDLTRMISAHCFYPQKLLLSRSWDTTGNNASRERESEREQLVQFWECFLIEIHR